MNNHQKLSTQIDLRQFLLLRPFQALFFSVIMPCNGRLVMTTGSVISFKLVIYMCPGSEFFQKISTYKWRRAIHLYKITNFFRNFDISVCVVQFLLEPAHRRIHDLILLQCMALMLQDSKVAPVFLHVSTHVVPRNRHFLSSKINFVRVSFFSITRLHIIYKVTIYSNLF